MLSEDSVCYFFPDVLTFLTPGFDIYLDRNLSLTITNYRYRQFGLTITLVTVPVQLMAFAPGCSTGKSPLMWSFIRVKPW